jgi:hypothetical protein
MQVIVNPEPRSISRPPPEVMIDTLPMWQVRWQRAPCATASDEILKGIDDLAQGVVAMSAAGLLRRK